MGISHLVSKLSVATAGAVSLALISGGVAQATSILSTSNGQVGTIDTATGNFTPFINSDPSFTDLALSTDGDLFGVTFSQLYSINQSQGVSSLIGGLGVNDINALGFSTNNQLYAAGTSGNFYTVDTSSGNTSLVARISGFSSSGDLVFNPDNNQFLATSRSSSTDTLLSIALDGTATQIGNIGFVDVFGLFFEDGTLFGYTANRQQITINTNTGAGTFNQNVTGSSGQIFGAASLPSTGPSTEPSTSVPEPTSILSLLAVGVVGTASTLKRRQKQKS
ncbi:PEP-CTERM sorting domain-containing protein [Coleofasciculus sp.]|uniref:PEP-CTERM sorting domain-containing protein n=1 Tax=Coleofasciculus sp. TaxID=3100458 RepID=UPI0039F91A31